MEGRNQFLKGKGKRLIAGPRREHNFHDAEEDMLCSAKRWLKILATSRRTERELSSEGTAGVHENTEKTASNGENEENAKEVEQPRDGWRTTAIEQFVGVPVFWPVSEFVRKVCFGRRPILISGPSSSCAAVRNRSPRAEKCDEKSNRLQS